MIVKKMKFFMYYTNEEKWLNEMAAQGYHFVKYSFSRYHFEVGEPGAYEYRMERLDAAPTSIVGKQYLDFMKELGIECVDTASRWAYFRREKTDESFEIYTDQTSKKKHLNRIIFTLVFAAFINLFVAIMNTFSKNSFYITRYFTWINWIAFIVLFVIIVKYFKMKRNITEEDKHNTVL